MQELQIAVEAARKAGALLKAEFGRQADVNEYESHDIKLALDVQAQELISDHLLSRCNGHGILGEEGSSGNAESEHQWIVDPIDGTVNFFYGIPHFCISIALRKGPEKVVAGVIYDPMRDEIWTATHDGPAMLNDEKIEVSPRTRLEDAIVTVGFAKTKETIETALPILRNMAFRVRKCRMLGSAALDLAYVATGRLDAYIEQGVSLWDIAAGKLIIERAGGRVDVEPSRSVPGKLAVVASSGKLDFSGVL